MQDKNELNTMIEKNFKNFVKDKIKEEFGKRAPIFTADVDFL